MFPRICASAQPRNTHSHSLPGEATFPRNHAISAGPREPPEYPPQASGNPLHDSSSLPCSIFCHDFSVTQKGRVSPITRKGLTTPSCTRPETPVSPNRASTTVTGTLHTHFFCRTDNNPDFGLCKSCSLAKGPESRTIDSSV